MGKQNYLVYDALPGLPAFPTREIENWDEWEEPDPPSLKETVTIEVNFNVYEFYVFLGFEAIH